MHPSTDRDASNLLKLLRIGYTLSNCHIKGIRTGVDASCYSGLSVSCGSDRRIQPLKFTTKACKSQWSGASASIVSSLFQVLVGSAVAENGGQGASGPGRRQCMRSSRSLAEEAFYVSKGVEGPHISGIG